MVASAGRSKNCFLVCIALFTASSGFALYGIAVVVPAVGQTLGGRLSDNLSWHWCFLINVRRRSGDRLLRDG